MILKMFIFSKKVSRFFWPRKIFCKNIFHLCQLKISPGFQKSHLKNCAMSVSMRKHQLQFGKFRKNIPKIIKIQVFHLFHDWSPVPRPMIFQSLGQKFSNRLGFERIDRVVGKSSEGRRLVPKYSYT